MSAPNCEACKKKPASVHFTEVTPQGKTRVELCRDCAEEKGILEEPNGLLDVAQGVEALLSSVSKVKTEKAAGDAMRCARCGLTFSEFQKLGKLGCAACYEAFARPLGPLMRKLHETDRHFADADQAFVAREPDEPHESLETLHAQLADAVRNEDYETAARVRDAIKRLETGGGSATADTEDRGDDAPPEREGEV